MTKREKVIGACVLGVTIIWLSLNVFAPAEQKTSVRKKIVKKVQKKNTRQKKESKKEEDKKIDFTQLANKIQLAKIEEGQAGPDPFKSLTIEEVHEVIVEKEEEIIEFQFRGIVWDKGVAAALINEKIVRLGDVISEYEVNEIAPNKVVLTKGEKVLTLYLFLKEQQEEPLI